jgi:hypothetical protein
MGRTRNTISAPAMERIALDFTMRPGTRDYASFVWRGLGKRRIGMTLAFFNGQTCGRFSDRRNGSRDFRHFCGLSTKRTVRHEAVGNDC